MRQQGRVTEPTQRNSDHLVFRMKGRGREFVVDATPLIRDVDADPHPRRHPHQASLKAEGWAVRWLSVFKRGRSWTYAVDLGPVTDDVPKVEAIIAVAEGVLDTMSVFS